MPVLNTETLGKALYVGVSASIDPKAIFQVGFPDCEGSADMFKAMNTQLAVMTGIYVNEKDCNCLKQTIGFEQTCQDV